MSDRSSAKLNQPRPLTFDEVFQSVYPWLSQWVLRRARAVGVDADTATDVAHETCVRVMNHWPRLAMNPSAMANINAYFAQTARHILTDYLRRRRVRGVTLADIEAVDHHNSPLDNTIESELLAAYNELLNSATVTMRQAWLLGESMTASQIGQALGIPTTRVNRLRFEFRQSLKALLAQ